MLKITNTDKAPAAIGPYSQAVSVGDLLFTSGQIALCPKSGEVVGTTIEEQTTQVIDFYVSAYSKILESIVLEIERAIWSIIVG